MGVLAGIGALDALVTDDPLTLFTRIDGIIDFTVPAATLALAELSAQARIVHVIGTTGIDAAGEEKIRAAARHARIVKSGNMSLGVNLLAALVRKVAATLDEDYDIEIVEMHHRHKIDAPSGTALLLGEAAAEGRGIDLAGRSVRSRDGHTGARPQGEHRLCHAARRVGGGRAHGDVRRAGRAHRTDPQGGKPRHLRPRRGHRGAVGDGPEARPLCDDRCPGIGVNMERLLVLVRHGQSEWNLKNLFTGWKDPDLTEQGVREAHAAGQKLKAKGFQFDIAYTSVLTRAQHTLNIMLDELGQPGLQTIKDQALNERDYGDLTGLNKDDARKKWGEEQVHVWRRSYDVPPPGGESLKDTLARALPYYMKHIQPDVLSGKRVLVAAHGNSIRALIMAIEGLSPEQILKRELDTGVPVVYHLGADLALSRSRPWPEARRRGFPSPVAESNARPAHGAVTAARRCSCRPRSSCGCCTQMP